MKKDSNYTFQVSISQKHYETKAQAKAAITGNAGDQSGSNKKDRISYLPVNITPCQLLDKVLNGYTFCALFSNFEPNCKGHVYVNTDGSFTSAGKAAQFFRGSYFIGVDIDETKYETSNELIRMLSLKPTLWYTSFSHMQIDENTGMSKGVRLRLIYVFDQLIEDKYYYRYCSSCLHQIIEEDIGEVITDKCGLSCCQYFNGTYINNSSITVEYDITSIIYSLVDFHVSEVDYLDYLSRGCDYKKINTNKKQDILDRIRLLSNHSNIITTPTPTQVISEWTKSKRFTTKDLKCEFDQLMIKDASLLHGKEFFDKYKNKYPYVYRVERDEWLTIGDVKYQLCDDDYLELKWIGLVNNQGEDIRITDGQHRRNTLFHRGWLRRVIMPEITPTILLFNLIVDRDRFFDNSDGVLNMGLLITKVKEIFSYSIDELVKRYSEILESTKTACKNKKFILHWTAKQKVKANSIAKEIRWSILDRIYDEDLTFAQNLEILNDSDFSISNSSLKRYCQDRGKKIQTSRKRNYELFRKLHRDGMSYREELDCLKEAGLKISIRTLMNYRQRLELEPIDS